MTRPLTGLLHNPDPVPYDAAEHVAHAGHGTIVCPCGTVINCHLVAANEYEHRRQMWTRAEPFYDPRGCFCRDDDAVEARFDGQVV